MEEEFIEIGKTGKPHGLGGEVKVFIEEAFEEDFLRTEVIFLLLGGKKPVPYFIDNVRGDTFILKLEDVNDRNDADAISKKSVFLRSADMLKEEERTFEPVESLEFEYCLGFTIVDETAGVLGEIERIEEMPQQEMAIISKEDKEILIPLNEVFIISINEDEKRIQMDLPEGLLDL